MISGLDPKETANLPGAAGGEMEMAVSLHVDGHQADDLYCDEPLKQNTVGQVYVYFYVVCGCLRVVGLLHGTV